MRKIEIRKLSKRYDVRKLNSDDVQMIYSFCKRNTQYYKYDLIYYQNNLYVAIVDNSGHEPNKEQKYLNNSLYLNDNLYLGSANTGTYWFLLTKGSSQPIYTFPSDYTQLPAHSIFFAGVN